MRGRGWAILLAAVRIFLLSIFSMLALLYLIGVGSLKGPPS